ncbi:hypothetical protein ACFLSJ_02900 [Verrucomicrobiota bacterium]
MAVAALVTALVVFRASLSLPDAPQPHRTPRVAAPSWPRSVALDLRDWTIVQSRGTGTAGGEAGDSHERFRLAGTFFAYGGEEPDSRTAIIEDLSEKTDLIVNEGDAAGDARIVRIYRDRVLLREGGSEYELVLGFAAVSLAGALATGQEPSPTGDVGLVDAFGGVKIDENRWVFDRSRLLEYYGALMDDPERLVQVLDSLDPVYAESGGITGYELGIEGEAEFFESVGMVEGDIVREVNSLPMTNRGRAEFFIREFVEDRASAFAVEVERGGQRRRLIYEIR